MAAVFGPRQDAESENPHSTATSLSDFDFTRKVLSFGYFSLHQQRKVTRREAKALDVRRKAIGFDFGSKVLKSKIKGVSPSRASYFLLLAHCAAGANGEADPKGERRRCESKKVTKENGLLVTSTPLKAFVVSSPFSDSPSMARSEHAGHPWPAPSGFPVVTAAGSSLNVNVNVKFNSTFASAGFP